MENWTEHFWFPCHVLGVINLRGKVIPVVDLRLKFNLVAAEASEQTCIVVVQVESERSGTSMVGLLVDAVEEVRNIDSGDIEAAPDFGGALKNVFIHGIAKTKEDVKTLLDIDKVIVEEDIL